jgi:hypothetical protein
MDSRPSSPRGLVSRSLLAAGIFAVVVVPGWTLGDLAERWTGNGLLDWMVTCGWTAVAVFVLAPRSSYRRRDAVLGLAPLLGWYLAALMAWRVALLPYRDWEPRPDELSRARWLTGGLAGHWRAAPPAVPRRRHARTRAKVRAGGTPATDRSPKKVAGVPLERSSGTPATRARGGTGR